MSLTDRQQRAIAELADRFDGFFPDQPVGWRTVGREAEHPLVRADGTMGDLSELWADLAAPGDLKAKHEGSQIVALEGPRFTYAAEVGKGTVEVITGPHDDLLQLREAHEEGVRRLVEVAAAHGQRLLGYGIQPLTPASLEIMTPKQRYGVLLEVLGDAWLWFTVTASDQVHVDIARAEMIAQTNLANLCAPLIVGLCANSPVHSGRYSGFASSREATMGGIHAQTHRHGMPAGPYADTTDFITRMAVQDLLMLRQDGVNVAATGRYVDRLESHGPDFDEYLLHEHYTWNSARPRTGHATLELRPACQQPPGEHMAATALGLAIVEAGPRLLSALEDVFGDDVWPSMRRWHKHVVTHGLADAPEGLLERVLPVLSEALAERGRGEEVLLEPLFERAARGMGPAAEVMDLEVPELVERVAWPV